jgi:hypothetical protein
LSSPVQIDGQTTRDPRSTQEELMADIDTILEQAQTEPWALTADDVRSLGNALVEMRRWCEGLRANLEVVGELRTICRWDQSQMRWMPVLEPS